VVKQGGGQPNLQKMIQQANKMQRDLAVAQEQLAATTVTGQASNGLVTVTMTGQKELQSVSIDPSVVDPDDVETLQDLVVVAFRDAMRAADDIAEETVGPLTSGLGALNIPGLL
jgi:DNA-binding YbaB/EbfC family protein